MHINRYFKTKASGEIFTGLQLAAVKSVMGYSIEELIAKELITELKDPSVKDILQANGKRNITPAIARYRDVNHCSGKIAAEAVDGMIKEMLHTKAKVLENEGSKE